MTPPFTADEARAQLEAMEPRMMCRDCEMIDPPTETAHCDQIGDDPLIHSACPRRRDDWLPTLTEAPTPLLRVEDLKRAMETIIALTEALDAAMAARARDARHLREWIETHATPHETSPPADP